MNEIVATTPVKSSPANLKTDFWSDRFAEAWERDRSLTARRFLHQHSEAAGDAEIVVHIAYEEFFQRWWAGENVPLDSLPEQFPECRDELGTLISIFTVAEQVPELFRPNLSLMTLSAESREEPICWPAIGATVEGFKFVELVGEGKFSRVYLAEEPALGNRQVIVKASCRDGGEAQALGKLRHPNIVEVYSVKALPAEKLTLICMPFMGRTTLEAVLNRLSRTTGHRACGRQLVAAFLPENESEIDPRLLRTSYVDAVVWLGVQLADALSYTHERGICHGDIKPSNILIGAGGRPLLLDFNLARVGSAQSNMLGGTIPYMSPEVMKNLFFRDGPGPSEVGVRSDLYSLATVLYELLCGDLPFLGYREFQKSDAATARNLFEAQQHGPQPLLQRNPDVGSRLAAIIERCLALHLDGRPAGAGELAASLRRLLTWRSRTGRLLLRHRRTVVGLALPLVAAAAVGVNVWATAPSPAQRAFAEATSAQTHGDYTTALACLADAEARGFDPQPVAELRQQAYYRLAEDAFGKQGFLAARDYATRALDAGLRNSPTYLLRARARLHLHELEFAAEDLEAANKFRPDVEIDAALGDYFCLLGKWKLAVAAYQRALKGFSSAALSNNMGYALRRSGDPRGALKWLDEAIASDSSLADPYVQRATIVAALAGQAQEPIPQQARDDIESALCFCPGNYRLCLSAASIYALSAAQEGRAEFRERARECLYESLRLGLHISEVPTSGALAELARQECDSAEYKAAMAAGSTATRSRVLGLLDSIAGIGL